MMAVKAPHQGLLFAWLSGFLGQTGRQSWPSPGPKEQRGSLESSGIIQIGLQRNQITRGISFAVTDDSSNTHYLPKQSQFLFS